MNKKKSIILLLILLIITTACIFTYKTLANSKDKTINIVIYNETDSPINNLKVNFENNLDYIEFSKIQPHDITSYTKINTSLNENGAFLSYVDINDKPIEIPIAYFEGSLKADIYIKKIDSSNKLMLKVITKTSAGTNVSDY